MTPKGIPGLLFGSKTGRHDLTKDLVNMGGTFAQKGEPDALTNRLDPFRSDLLNQFYGVPHQAYPAGKRSLDMVVGAERHVHAQQGIKFERFHKVFGD